MSAAHTPHALFPLLLSAVLCGQTDAGDGLGREIVLEHAGRPPLQATFVLPAGAGPHPAALLVSPAGEHPRDELRRGGRHLRELARALARGGVASLRVDNPGVGGSRSGAVPAWTWQTTTADQAALLGQHLAWLAGRSEVDANRVGVVAHGDGTVPAARMIAARAPAFAVLLSPAGIRPVEALARSQAGKLPGDVPDQRREEIAGMLQAALEKLVADGPTPAAVAALAPCFAAMGAPAEEAEAMAARFAESNGQPWHRDYLGHRPRELFRAIESPVLAVFAQDDGRMDGEAAARAAEDAFRSAGAFNAGVVRLDAGGHFLEPDDGEAVLRSEVAGLVLRCITDATGWLPEVALPGAPAPAGCLVLDDVTVVDVAAGALLRGRTVVVRDGAIAAVGPRDGAVLPDGAQVVAGRGRFVIPGLWDAHVHLTLWGRDALPRAVAHGVTTVRDMGGDAQELLRWRDAAARGELLGPRLLLAGPFVDGDKPNAQYRRIVRDASEVAALVEEIHGLGVDFVKVHSRLPPAALPAVVEAARARGLLVCGHPPVGVTPLQASELGMASIEHADSFFSAPVRADPPAAAGWPQARAFWQTEAGAAALAAIAGNGTVVVPTLVTVATGAERLGGVFGAVLPWTREITRALHEAAVPLCAGTDFARRSIGIEPGASLHRELGLLVAAGLTPADALRAATLVPARMMGCDGERGSVAVGRQADLVLLREDPLADIANTSTIDAVVLRGAWLPRELLDAALARAREVRGE